MKLRFNRQEITEALSAVCSVATARSPKEILRCVRVEARPDVLVLLATDLEVSLRYSVAQVEVEEPGETLVVADTLTKIARECADELLSIETTENVLHVRGVGSHFQIVTQDPADFPAIPSMKGEPDITVEYALLHRLIDLTVFAAGRESTRYAITGVLWEVEGNRLTLAATDGRRLSVAHGDLIGEGSTLNTSVIVPSKALSLFGRLPAEADVQVGVKMTSNQLLLNMGRAMISSSLVEGQFPRYEDVIPTDCDCVAELNTAEFLSALKRAALLTNEESKGVRFAFCDNDLTLSSRAPEQGEATIGLAVRYKGEPLEIGFNPTFLIEMLRVVDAEQITFALKEPNRPGVVRVGNNFVYVVMPVNLSSA